MRERFGPWAVVTGASSGIGEEFARQLAREGLHLVLVARRLGHLETLGKALAKEHGVEFRAVEADLSSPAAVDLVESATADLDVGLLVNNAGTGVVLRFLDLELSTLVALNQLNALTPMALTHRFGRRFRDRGRGGIILSGAMGDTNGLPFMAGMAASKAMVTSLAQGVAEELRGTGVQVTSVQITPTDTAILDTLGFRHGAMPLAPLSTAQCVRETLRALVRGRTRVVPGLRFRLMTALVPVGLQRRLTGALLKKNNGIA